MRSNRNHVHVDRRSVGVHGLHVQPGLHVYGKDIAFRANKYGPNNIQLTSIGNLEIAPSHSGEATYEMSFSGHMSTNEDYKAIHEEYAPVFFAESNGENIVIKSYSAVKNKGNITEV